MEYNSCRGSMICSYSFLQRCSPTTPCGLQNQLDSLKVCCDRLKMEVNTDKTKVMVFRKGGHLSKHEKWYYDGAEMEVVY